MHYAALSSLKNHVSVSVIYYGIARYHGTLGVLSLFALKRLLVFVFRSAYARCEFLDNFWG